MTAEHDSQSILDAGEQVFTHTWQSTPTKGGTETVYRLDDQYYAVMSYGGKPVGPYPNLWDVVPLIGLEEVNIATVALTCTELLADELAARLRTKEEPGHTFTINGEPWAVGNGQAIMPGA